MLDGRVKTLHPKIHSGILFDRSKQKHKMQMKKKKFEPIDLIIVNFYPFEKTLQKKSLKITLLRILILVAQRWLEQQLKILKM